jgi:dTDP-glucose 4,6-dehydratase
MTKYRKLVVTGHLGFIGSAFCWNYRDSYTLVGVDFAGWGSMKENLAPGVRDVRIDIAEADDVRALLDEVKPDAIVNFAAESHVDRAVDQDLPFWRSNVMGARNLAIEAQQRGLRLVQVSTDEVYGDATEATEAWTERSPMAPRNPYSVTKTAAEMMLLAYENTYGLDVVITRGANTIGPRQFPEKAVPKAVDHFLRGSPFPLFRTPARRMWLYVDDHASGVEAALRKGRKGEAYNIAPGIKSEAYTHEVIAMVKEQVGNGEIEEVDDRKGYDLRYWMSAEKAQKELEWAPEHDLRSTVQHSVNWYLENREWLGKAGEQLREASGEPTVSG